MKKNNLKCQKHLKVLFDILKYNSKIILNKNKTIRKKTGGFEDTWNKIKKRTEELFYFFFFKL